MMEGLALVMLYIGITIAVATLFLDIIEDLMRLEGISGLLILFLIFFVSSYIVSLIMEFDYTPIAKSLGIFYIMVFIIAVLKKTPFYLPKEKEDIVIIKEYTIHNSPTIKALIIIIGVIVIFAEILWGLKYLGIIDIMI